MPDTPTTRLGLYKSASDGSEDVNYTQDIGQNLDKLDAAVGFQVVTSSTRPSSPYSGKAITESDTSYRTYFSNGTSPASASWVQIPNSSGSYSGLLAQERASAATTATQIKVTGDSQQRLTIGADGKLTWGSGSATGDTVLYREAANVLCTEDIVRVYRSATSDNTFSARVTGDTASRWFVNADGTMAWGPGGASAADATLARTGTGALTLTGALTISSNLTINGIGQRLFAYKAADTARTTGTGDDPDLTFTVAANAVYRVHGALRVNTTDATNADINVDWTVPASAGGFWVGVGQPTGATGTDGTVRMQGSAIDASRAYGAIVSAGNELAIVIDAILITASAGTYALNWSRTGGSGTLTLMQHSHLELIREA